MERIQYLQGFCVNRWIGYFDLLGVKALVRAKHHISVFNIYSRAIEEVKKRNRTLETIDHAWFSDTFIIYSEDAAISCFAELDHISRWFSYFLIESHVPVRGAIAVGEFYADKKNALYFGDALIEAYEYGEAQDWIGFVLCPSAERKLNSIGLFSNESLPYAHTNIPYNKRKDELKSNLPACILGCWVQMGDKNPTLKNLYEMRDSAVEEKIKQKYDNSITFIEKNKRVVVA